MGLLTKTELLTRQELKKERVDFEGDNYVYVRQMTGHEKDDYETSMMKTVPDGKGGTRVETNLRDYRAKLAVQTMCDEEGKLIFLPNDYTKLSDSMSAEALDKVVVVAQRINGMTEKAQEEIIKNSEAVLDGSSNSDFAEN